MRYVITGTPRSGTKYMSVLLQHLGQGVTHETVFRGLVINDAHNMDGDSSWEAGFHLTHPTVKRLTVVHVMRHPKLVLPSLANMSFLKSQQDVYWSRIRNMLPHLSQYTTYESRLARFWLDWNYMIAARADMIIDVSSVKSWQIGQLIGAYVPQDMIDAVPKDINQKIDRKVEFDWYRVDEKLFRLLDLVARAQSLISERASSAGTVDSH